jgi:hypothetical protein
MAELVTRVTWDSEKKGRLLFDAVSTIDHLMDINEIAALIQPGGPAEQLLQRSATPALPAPAETKQIAAPIKPVGAVGVQVKPKAAGVITAAAEQAKPAAPKARGTDFKTRVAGMNSARETVQEAAEAVKAAPKTTTVARKPGPLSKKPSAEDVPTPEKFGMAKPATPGASLKSALSMLDLED